MSSQIKEASVQKLLQAVLNLGKCVPVTTTSLTAEPNRVFTCFQPLGGTAVGQITYEDGTQSPAGSSFFEVMEYRGRITTIALSSGAGVAFYEP